jgi:hypothetical protein
MVEIMKTKLIKLVMLLLVCCVSSLALAQHHNDLSWTWTQGTGGTATGFNVRKATVSTGPFTTITTVPTTTLTYSDTSNLVEGQHNYYQIEATGPGGVSASSNKVDLTTPFSLPVAPTATGKAF